MKWVVFYGFAAVVTLGFSFAWILGANDTDLRIVGAAFGTLALMFAWRGGMAAQALPPDEPPYGVPVTAGERDAG